MAKKKKTRTKKIAAPSRRRTAPAAAPLDLRRCVLFLEHEARLLDEAKFDDWLALFTADAWYWVPSEPGQSNPHDTVSLIYGDRRLLETRVRRLASPRMYSQEPRSRTSRIVANATIEDAEGRAATVRSKFLMIEYRREQQRLFAGTAWHRLVQLDGAIRSALGSTTTRVIDVRIPRDDMSPQLQNMTKEMSKLRGAKKVEAAENTPMK